MQLIWVSGPVGKIRTINLNAYRLILLTLAGTFSLLICGALLHYVGFRIALEINPTILGSYSQLHSTSEVENIKKLYIQKYQEIQKQSQQNQRLMVDLQEQNKKLINLAIPKVLQKEKTVLPSSGGPFIPIVIDTKKNIGVLLEDSVEHLKMFNQQLLEQQKVMDQQIQWLMSRPLTLPILGNPILTSGFGGRLDPFTKTWGAHEGLDFQESIGSNILAAGAGKVLFSGWETSYGNSILIDHGNGYTSRYAHASRLFVRAGDKVLHQQPIGLVGSTGRSTGPHLHFEIIKNGIPVDPKEYLIGLKKDP
jgi:murein DD-endopeptidase MepM/ murein hydrolase activator NlpD